MRHHCRIGITMVDTVAAIFIIVILAALILPAINHGGRTPARRAQCFNNLRQLGTAITAFHDAHRYLPPSRTDDGSFVPDQATHSWVTLVLPYMEEKTLQDAMALDQDWDAKVNQQPINTQLKILVCPSAEKLNKRSNLTAAATQAVTDYAPTSEVDNRLYRFPRMGQYEGPIIQRVAGIAPTDPSNRMWANGRELKNRLGAIEADGARHDFADFEDGLTNTILLAEVAGRPLHYIKGSQVAADTARFHSGWADPRNAIRLNGASIIERPLSATTPGPCPLNCTNHAWDSSAGDYGHGEMYSFHPGVVNILYADGRTTSLEDSVAIEVIAAMVTRNGEEVYEAP